MIPASPAGTTRAGAAALARKGYEMSPEDIKALRELEAAATLGPWGIGRHQLPGEELNHVVDMGQPPSAPFAIVYRESQRYAASAVCHSDNDSSEANAALIAAARNALPALLDLAEAALSAMPNPKGGEEPEPVEPSALVPRASIQHWTEYQTYRSQCAEAAKPVLRGIRYSGAPIIESYANAEYWAGWNAAIMHSADISRMRHRYWKESDIGSSLPETDAAACEDIAAAIELNLHRKPPVSRPDHPDDISTGQGEG